MKTYSYEGCRSCLIRACCSSVCEEYKQYIRDKMHINIMIDRVSLDLCERMLKSNSSKGLTFRGIV